MVAGKGRGPKSDEVLRWGLVARPRSCVQFWLSSQEPARSLAQGASYRLRRKIRRDQRSLNPVSLDNPEATPGRGGEAWIGQRVA
jgi:hypothetical protein